MACSLIEKDKKAAIDKEMITGLTDFLKSYGKSDSFGNSVKFWIQQIEVFRRDLCWEEIPEDIIELCKRRKNCIITHALRDNLLQRSDDGTTWQITKDGRFSSISLNNPLLTLNNCCSFIYLNIV